MEDPSMTREELAKALKNIRNGKGRKALIDQFKESQKQQPRREKIRMDMKNQEQSLIDFVHGGCTDQNGDPINVNCTEIWEKYQNELNQPGCRRCTKRKVLKKYSKLIENLGLGNEESL